MLAIAKDEIITLNNVRISFPQLHEAKTVNGQGEPAFSAAFLMAPGDANIALIEKTVLAVGFKKWKQDWKTGKPGPDGKPTPGIYTILKAQSRLPLKSGDEKANYEGYAGNFSISARSPTRPGVIDRDTSPITAQDDKCKSGDYVRASVEIWAMDNKFGKRVCTKLRWVQFLQMGDRFSGGGTPISPDEYENLAMIDEASETATTDYSSEYA